ncbi:aminopeptidase N [Tabrizicola oligotrophica]|uniref:Aminopeptidase N n=1 Tax=Tabrizicola oligotrophica TaxID=2710650 RepID=A0A6M0QUZ0_9RHOB|nr:aminopeptidase N [Tabrizicola oligotrophica]NEY91306.1 aminopeptidase N [Tabrizicola oligotrophica]
MTAADPRTVYLADYQPFPFTLDQVSLTFRLAPRATRVLARLAFAPNPARPGRHDLRLNGENLRLVSAAVNGQAVSPAVDAEGLTIAAADLPTGAFTLDTEVEISPETNTALEGLYMSKGMYCTQCEAEGFRKITYYPDRPDVMARFAVRIEGEMPVLLSNGNPLGQGPGWAEWDDPWPKPAYLFALVAGALVAHPGQFTTASGRDVALNIWVRPGDENRCAWGMEALKKSMAWDEDVYGREYDLDIFNIVAVDDFNMGAMENKGLNIFNSKVVLASPDTATDDDFARIEAIIAHEYFHNWTGNRITCRDWFQLCLKEGLTVFRDQQFSGDMRSPAVKRIEDVLTLRARQFREDQGPLAHAVRPESFVEINNFYTATIYEKGAEVIGMLKRLVGDAAYARALDLYFSRHDGEAATIEDWLKVFEDATGRDLTQFKRWYSEAGTPRLKVQEAWAAAPAGGTYTLTFTQVNPPTPGQSAKGAKVIPIAVGLLNPNGDEVVPTTVLEMNKTVQSFAFENLSARPVPSILRGFSAPVVLEREVPQAERAFLLAHDTDPFNRWEAGRALAKDVLARMVTQGAKPTADLLDGMARLAFDDSLDPAFRALALRLPSDDDMAATLHAAGHVPDPARIHAARRALGLALAERLAPGLDGLERSCRGTGEFSAEAGPAGKRALRLAALAFLTRLDGGKAASTAFVQAYNMTESFGALAILLENCHGDQELAAFGSRWTHDRLVMDKWFAVQVGMAAPEAAAATVARLTARPDFDMKNPNRFRAVIGALTTNHAGFHHDSGAGYQTLADWLIRLDPLNPQTAARMSTAFETWPRYDADRQEMIRAELARILATPGLSRDLSEMAGRMLGA